MSAIALRNELINDPLARGYAGMTDQQAADSLNTANRTVPVKALSSADIYNAIVPSEFTSLTAAQQTTLRDILGLGGGIDVSTGTNARTVLLNLFGAGTTTRTNLAALTQRTVTRAEELGIPRVKAGWVKDARL